MVNNDLGELVISTELADIRNTLSNIALGASMNPNNQHAVRDLSSTYQSTARTAFSRQVCEHIASADEPEYLFDYYNTLFA
jgi:hypothetical protein